MAIDRTKLTPGITAVDLPRPVVVKLAIPPGYFRKDIARETFAELIGSGLPFNLALTPEAVDGAPLIFLTLDFVRDTQAAQSQPTIKSVPPIGLIATRQRSAPSALANWKSNP